MGFGTTFQKLIMKSSHKMGRQLEDYVKTKYMGDPNGIEGLRRKRQDNGTDLGKLRREAVANGFNPLTVLRATGGQGFYKNEIPMGRLSSDTFFNTFDRIKQRQYDKLPASDEIKEPLNPYRDLEGFLDPEHKVDGTKRYFKKEDGTDTEIEIGTNIFELSFDQIKKIRAEDLEEQYGDLAQIVFGVIRLGADIVDVTQQKAAIKKAIEKHKRRQYKLGVGDRSGNIIKTTIPDNNLYSDTLKTLNKSKYKNKPHPRNTNRGNHGALVTQ